VTLFALFKLLHIASAIWLVGGLLGRAIALVAVRRASAMPILKALADVSGRIEDFMIAPGSLAVIVTGIATTIAGGFSLFGPFGGGPLWVFVPFVLAIFAVITTPLLLARDRRWGLALQMAASQGKVTEELRHYLRANTMLRRYAPDITFAGLIVILMVLKPF
jgi:uncharacterized membrane protein